MNRDLSSSSLDAPVSIPFTAGYQPGLAGGPHTNSTLALTAGVKGSPGSNDDRLNLIEPIRKSSEILLLGRPGRHSFDNGNGGNTANMDDIMAKIQIENKIREGAENLLQVFDTRKDKEGKELLKQQVESQLDAANAKIALLQLQLKEFGVSRSSLDLQRNSGSFGSFADNRSEQTFAAEEDLRSENGSPTWSLSDLMQSLESGANLDAEKLVGLANELVSLLQRHPLLKYDLVVSQLADRIRILLLHTQMEVVASGYRLARYAITDIESIRLIQGLKIDYFVIRTLTKDSKSQIERIQSIKLIRSFLDIHGGVDEISIGVIRALVAVAEQSDDKLHNISIETLTEIFINRPDMISKGGGIRVLLQTIVDGPYDLSSPIAMALIYVLNSSKGRKLLRQGKDIEYLVSAFTDIQVRGHINSEKLQNSAKVLSSVLRTWPGLFALSIDDFHPLKALIQCLTFQIPSLREILLDIFFSALRIKPLSWSSSFLAGRRLTTFGRVPDMKNEVDDVSASDKALESPFIEHYTALLLLVFIHCGLVDNLLIVLETADTDSINTRKATLLLGEVLSLAAKLLPPKILEPISSLSGLFEIATAPGAEPTSSAASAAVFQIEKISRRLNRGRRLTGNKVEEYPTGKSMSDEVKLKMGVQIDDAGFKQLLLDTQVLHTKTYTKWNWDALTELIQGPLLNPRRLEEVIKSTKFMKRLMSFYRPFKYRFSSVKRTKPNQKYIQVGKALLVTLLYNPEGVRYLTENKLLRQIAECLAQLDPMSGISSTEPLFSSQRLENTLSHGYFTLLGTLSADPNGMAMMERWRMFNMFYHLSELRSREDLITSFISSMDYNLQGHPRIILCKALTTGQKNVRMFATEHLRTLKDSKEDVRKWAIGLLFTQLYDPEVDVCKLAVNVLEDYCSDPENLIHFVKLKPSLDHLGDIGAPLLLRFLSSSEGFEYLQELDYIEREMDNWFHGENELYVQHIEEYLERAQSPWLFSKDRGFPASTPRHFYGELTLTEDGCQLLSEKGHFEYFAYYIHDHCMEESDEEIILKLKGCLWAAGNIGSNPLGAPFLENSELTGDLIRMARESAVFSLKG